MTRAEQYIIENHDTLSASELSHKLHLSKAKIQEILTAHRLTAKEEQHEPIERVKYKRGMNICAGRPESCFKCPYPDCTCIDSMTEGEISYKFAGIQSDSESAVKQRKARRTKRGRPK